MTQNRVRILLIEDNPGDVELITRMIKLNPTLLGEIVQADRLSIAKTLLAERKFDIILLDLGLPDSQGFETIKQIDSSEVPIIVLTSLTDESLGIQAVHTGTEDFLVKGEITGKILIKSIEYAIERHTIKKMLRLSEEKYQALAENTDDIIFSMDTSGIFTYISPQINGYGFLADEIIGKSLRTIIHPEDIDRVESELSRDLETGAQFHSMFRIPDKWGGLDNWFEEKGTLRLDQYGKTLGIYGVLRDVSERKRAQELLKESEILLNEVGEMALVGGWELDARTNAVRWTKETYRIHDISEDEQFDLSKAILFYDIPGRSTLETALQRCMEKGESFDLELPFTSAKDRHLWTRSLGRAVNVDGKVRKLVGTLQDITERKRTEKSLRLANKKLNLLSSITRHDINNQLTVQMGYLSLLEKKLPDATLNEYFLKVSTAANRISAMVQFTKEYENIGVHAPTWQDSRTLVDTAAKQAPLGKVMVKNDLPDGAEVFADPLVVKVFYNLMDNAARYGGKITTIRFSLEEREGDQILVCEDDGDGVVAEEKEKIFERGFGKNTGLGLALSREILAITGITIKETGEPGKGARFEMVVPKGIWRTTGDGA